MEGRKVTGALLQLGVVAGLMGAGVWWVSKPAPPPPPPPPSVIEALDAGAKAVVVEPQPLDVKRISSTPQFDAIAFSGARGVVLGKSVKFLVDARDPDRLQIHYMNANFAGPVSHEDATKMHYGFAVAVLGIELTSAEFSELAYEVEDKRFYAGTLQEYRLTGQSRPTYAIQFYPQDTIRERRLLLAVQQVHGTFAIPDAKLLLVPTGQQQTIETVRSQIEGLGIDVRALDEVLGAVDYMPMQTGEAWGFLRIFPSDPDELTARDIPVFDELPLDLTVVAGTVTRAVQDTSSHINLKSKERGTPNMVLRSAALDHARLAPFVDQPVHLVVRADGYELTRSTPDDVDAKLADRLRRPWRPLAVVPTAQVVAFDDMCPRDPAACVGGAGSWGGKAANLGFLRHPDVLGRRELPNSLSGRLGYDLAPPGVAVGVQTYVDFVANNPVLADALRDFVAREKAQSLSPRERVAALDRIQAMFMEGAFPPGVVARIQAAAVAALPAGAANLKVRSSANAEDISGFDGAGLYDSFRVKLSAKPRPCKRTVDEDDREVHVRPRTLECVMKGVYASLWNKRAVEERTFARVDHETAAMGLAIIQRYKEHAPIMANAVVVTRVLNADGVYGYSVSTQQGNNVVTNPAPGTHSEAVVAGFYPDQATTITVTRYAKPLPDMPPLTRTILNRQQMLALLEVAKHVEIAYCHAKQGYYDGLGGCEFVIYDDEKSTSLDMEVKVYEGGEILCKQAREFSGK